MLEDFSIEDKIVGISGRNRYPRLFPSFSMYSFSQLLFFLCIIFVVNSSLFIFTAQAHSLTGKFMILLSTE